MERKPQTDAREPITGAELRQWKECVYCKERKPLSEFPRRTGRKAGKTSRRGACRACRKRRRKAAKSANSAYKAESRDVSILRLNRQGVIWMRGKTDKGRRWRQETDLETAVTLVKENAAVVVNRHTIRRLYSNKTFRQYILTRDRYTCYYCGEYGDTIDHLLPRSKGGHTTPVNCVCACNLCNQSKADRSLDEFMVSRD